MPKLKFIQASTEFLFNGRVELVELEDFIMFGCKSGNCGTCIIQVIDGADNLSEKTAREQRLFALIGETDPSMRLACQCSAFGNVVLREVN